MAKIQRRNPPDGHWGWMVLLGAFVYNVFQVGTHKALGVFVPQFAEGLNISVGAVGTSCGVAAGLKCILGPLWAASMLITSTRLLSMSGGILTGLGFIFAGLATNEIHLTMSMVITSIGLGLPLVAIPRILNDYFDRKYSLATGIALSGAAIGMMIFPPLMEYLIDLYGWRNALFLLGALCFNICVSATLFRPISSLPNSCKRYSLCRQWKRHKIIKEDNSDKEQDTTNGVAKTIFLYFGINLLSKNVVLLMAFVSFTLWGIAFTGWVLFLVSYAITLGFSAYTASFISAIGGIGTFIGRILSAPFTDRKLISGQMMFTLLSCGGALVLFLYPFCTSYWSLTLLSFLSGIFIGSPPPTMVIFIKELTSNLEDFTGALGLHFLSMGIGMFSGGPIAGYIFDATGNFNFAFYSMAAAELLAAVLVFLLKKLYK